MPVKTLFAFSLFFRYIAKHYLYAFFALFFGLTIAFALLDYFQMSHKLPSGFNMHILYIYYKWQEGIGTLNSIIIVLAIIVMKTHLVRNNTQTALHAIGFSQRAMIRPILFVMGLIYLFFVYLNTTDFVYGRERANAIQDHLTLHYNINDLFFKYNDNFIYVKHLDPGKGHIEGLTLFEVKHDQVTFTLKAPSADFDGKHWIAKHAVQKIHRYDNAGRLIGYETKRYTQLPTLEGYKPKIIESFDKSGGMLTLPDALLMWQLLHRQGLESRKVRTLIYVQTVVPLFALALSIILFIKMPFHSRMTRMGSVIAMSLASTLAIWGTLFWLRRIALAGIVAPEIALVLPVAALFVYAVYLLYGKSKVVA